MQTEERYTETVEQSPRDHRRVIALLAGLAIGWYARGFWGMVYDYRAWALIMLLGIVLAAAVAVAGRRTSQEGA